MQDKDEMHGGNERHDWVEKDARCESEIRDAGQ